MSEIRYPYVKGRGGGFMPWLPVLVGYRGSFTERFPFLVDSGAMFSFASKESIEEVFPGIHDLPEKGSGCIDVHGIEIAGSPVMVDLQIDGLPALKEEIWFSTRTNLFLLGQSLFERMETRFRNFAPDRHFELRSPPDGV